MKNNILLKRYIQHIIKEDVIDASDKFKQKKDITNQERLNVHIPTIKEKLKSVRHLVENYIDINSELKMKFRPLFSDVPNLPMLQILYMNNNETDPTSKLVKSFIQMYRKEFNELRYNIDEIVNEVEVYAKENNLPKDWKNQCKFREFLNEFNEYKKMIRISLGS